MSIERIAWIVAVLVCTGLAALCFVIGYSGYGWTVIAIGLAAAINLLPERKPEAGAAEPSGAGEALGE